MKNLENHVAGAQANQAEQKLQQLPAFTPGPWRVAPASHYAGSAINVDAGENGLAGFICETGHRGDHEAAANAYLIAAAPEMYTALEKIIAMNIQYASDRYGDRAQAETMACVQVARNALRKARGKQ